MTVQTASQANQYTRLVQSEDSSKESRDEFERDADRVLYSSNFRRLAGVTQVISPGDDFVHHDRLTHSLKVAQVARRMASGLGNGLSPEVAHTAALCHDLGHPPFGHAAEEELMGVLDGRIDESGVERGTARETLQSAEATRGSHQDNAALTPPSLVPILSDSFEGNAQSFRIIARLAARKSGERDAGLNLTARTLAAVQKYPWLRGEGPTDLSQLSLTKWGAFESERALLTAALEGASDAGVMGDHRSLEAEVMDWADDISYAVHDTEDFYRAGLIPLHELKNNPTLWEGTFLPYALDAIENRKFKTWTFTTIEFDGVAKALWRVLPSAAYSGDRETREQLHKFGSNSIDTLMQDLHILPGVRLEIPTTSLLHVEVLKKMARFFVIDRPELQFAQQGQRRVVRELFFALRAMAMDAFRKGNETILPGRFRDYCEATLRHSDYPDRDKSVARATVDFICSLTDKQAATMASQLAGRTLKTSAGIASV